MDSKKIALLTDSCADIPIALQKQYDIFVLPLRLLFSDGEYLDGKTITAQQVYERLPSEMPTTSLPSAQMIEQIFQAIREKGYQRVLAVHLSAGLSGTYNMVRLMAEEITDLEIAVFDSVSGSLGIGLTVLQAARWIAQGVSWEQLLQLVPQAIAGTKVFFCIDSLEYLQKGGRIGKVAAMAGTLLQMKPILSFAENGELTSVAKVRGKKAAISQMLALFASAIPKEQRIVAAVVHGGIPEQAKTLQTMAQVREDTVWFESEIDGTLASYVGPNLLGIGFQIVPQTHIV